MYNKTISEDLIIPIPENVKDLCALIKSDYYRYVCKEGKCLKILKLVCINPSFAFVFFLRLSAIRWFGRPLAKVVKTLLGRKRGLMISENMPLGYGFYIAHAFGTIINPSAVIGNNCTISQFTTIGAMTGRAAVIYNDVYIGPTSCIVENIKIESNSVIGAGAVVVKNVPSGVTVAGVPAKIVSLNNSSLLISNRYPYENLICD